MKKIIYNSKTIFAILTIVTFCTTILVNKYVIAAGNDIIVTAPSTVEEGNSITLNVTFGSSISNIWLSDGDIIKKGFSGTVKVNKVSNNQYTIVISNVSGVGTGKYVVINSGVGYVNNTPTSAVSSNVFSITAKKKTENNNTNNNNSSNTTNNNSSKNNNSSNTTNNNSSKNNNSSNTTNNNSSKNNNSSNTTNNNSSNNNTSSNITNNNNNNNSSSNIAKSNNNSSVANNNVTDTSKIKTTEDSKEKTESKEESKETKKVLREIPNTGKI